MNYNKEKSIEILKRTPEVLKTLLSDLHADWVINNEGPETFSPYDIIGHLIHGEKTDWRNRTMIILDHGVSKTFEPYDRFAQERESKGKTIDQLLEEFALLRKKNMEWFRSLQLTEAALDKQGLHPVLGPVTLRQLLSTWVIHDLTHISQITRVMAKQYKEEIGPWLEFFRVMNF
ncbi:MAG TPA: DinB family protein [Chitinophagaceae bacterium]